MADPMMQQQMMAQMLRQPGQQYPRGYEGDPTAKFIGDQGDQFDQATAYPEGVAEGQSPPQQARPVSVPQAHSYDMDAGTAHAVMPMDGSGSYPPSQLTPAAMQRLPVGGGIARQPTMPGEPGSEVQVLPQMTVHPRKPPSHFQQTLHKMLTGGLFGYRE